MVALQWCRIIALMLLSGYCGWWVSNRRVKYLRNYITDLRIRNAKLKEKLFEMESSFGKD